MNSWFSLRLSRSCRYSMLAGFSGRSGFIGSGLNAASLSFATFCIKTQLSPSAVMAAWAKPMKVPNLEYMERERMLYFILWRETVQRKTIGKRARRYFEMGKGREG